MTDLFDNCGMMGGRLTYTQIAQRLPEEYGNLSTRIVKVRAAIAYIIREGEITGQPQIFKLAKRTTFQNPEATA